MSDFFCRLALPQRETERVMMRGQNEEEGNETDNRTEKELD